MTRATQRRTRFCELRERKNSIQNGEDFATLSQLWQSYCFYKGQMRIFGAQLKRKGVMERNDPYEKTYLRNKQRTGEYGAQSSIRDQRSYQHCKEQ